ncbi:B-cell receptor CD22-like isoform X2 [Hyla sarda]|uniref:B-cell receptor CD22-like isoform X2 n=1 Tax=Hyla sarda TaxID=327740 RepID=UPI0024C308CF|nr:B-cell receptor CD22-like isoform X2 [Hyla sarda]
MDAVKPVYLLLICQGFYLGSVGQRWTFPSRILALIGSCVEIPCTYDPGTSGPSSTVWYLYDRIYYQEILNTKNPSSVLQEYRGRTSLVPGQDCTLRIDPVRREDGNRHYYPGITEHKSINAYDQQSKMLYLLVTDRLIIPQLQGPATMAEGEANTIRCSVDHTCRSSRPSIRWNKPGQVTQKSVDITLEYWIEESELIFIPTYVDDKSPIQCTATYHNGQKVTASDTPRISYPPKNVTIIIGITEVMEGNDVTLQCNSVSNPDVSEYEWYKGKNRTKSTSRGGKEIIVRNVTRNMEPYSCAAINIVGRGESALMEIPVLYAATGVQIKVKTEGEFSALICVFQSSRPDVSHYTWMKDGSILHNETGKTLTLQNDDTNGQYSCIAHNRAGDSFSEEIHIKRDELDLPLILGTVAGVIFLFFFILIVYFCLRQKKKSSLPNSPIHGTLPARTPNDYSMAENENQYGNIQNTHPAPSIRSGPSVDMKVEDNYVIYSNSEALQPSNEVAYSVISHRRHDQEPLTSSRTSQVEDVEYATLRH